MQKIILIAVQVLLIAALSPLVNGLTKKFKSWMAGRRGPRILQPYYNLAKLLRKDSVVSEHASWIFRAAPWIVFSATLAAGLLVPVWSVLTPLHFLGDVIVVAYLFGLARFFMALAGLDTASAFGGMGSSREMTVAALIEPAFLVALFSIGIQFGSMNLTAIAREASYSLYHIFSPAFVLAFAGFFIVLIAESGRVPVDNPDTHLELTMIHEAMILDYSGKRLALMEWGSYIKQFILICIAVNLFAPWGLCAELTVSGITAAAALFAGKVILCAFCIAAVEILNAKVRLFRVPDLLTVSFSFSFLSFLYAIFAGK
jgi:formate hydrogenlyase subunit 4